MEGEQWRLFTSIVVYNNWADIIINFLGLHIIGVYIAHYTNPWKLPLFYLLGGVSANMIFLLLNQGEIFTGGPEQIVFLIPIIILTLVANKKHLFKSTKLLWQVIIPIMMYSIAYGIQGWLNLQVLFINLIVGFLFGAINLPTLKTNIPAYKSAANLCIAILITGAIAYPLLSNIKSPEKAYTNVMSTLEENEKQSLNTFNHVVQHMADSTQKEELIHQLKHNGIAPLKENIGLLRKLEDNMLVDIDQLVLYRQYFELRLQTMGLLKTSIEKGTDEYNKELNTLNDSINIIQEKLVL